MKTTADKLLTLTAGDLMTRNVVRLPETIPLREAAELLVNNQVGGAPVVDPQGRCVGVLSATDFLRLAVKRNILTEPLSSPLPRTCSFWVKQKTSDGHEVHVCTLPPGVCPLQVKQKMPGEKELLICREPHCVLLDWQAVELEKLPADEVRNYMTHDPVMVKEDLSIRALAMLMIDAHIHRVVVIDEQQNPIGIVSGTDLLAALAYAEDE